MKKQGGREEARERKGKNETLAQQGRDQGKDKSKAQVKRSRKTAAAAIIRRGGRVARGCGAPMPQGRRERPQGRQGPSRPKFISVKAQSRSERLRLLHLTPLKRSFVPKLAETATTRTRSRGTLSISSKLKHGGEINYSNNYTIQSIEEEHL